MRWQHSSEVTTQRCDEWCLHALCGGGCLMTIFGHPEEHVQSWHVFKTTLHTTALSGTHVKNRQYFTLHTTHPPP